LSLGKLVSSLLDDSKKFLFLAKDAARRGENELTNSYCRAVFFCAWSALEGWINYIAYSFAENDSSLTEYEVSFLKEKKIEVDDNGTVKITNQNEYRRTLTKLVFILRRFGKEFDLKKSLPGLWAELKRIEKIRHTIVHPRTREEEAHLSLGEAEKCYKLVVKIVDLLKKKSLWLKFYTACLIF